MLRACQKKWNSKRGEAIAESLVSMLVIVLAGLMLAGAIVSSARMNNAAAKIATFPQYAGTAHGERTASISGSLAGGFPVSAGIPVTVHEDEGEMFYYEKR